MFFELKTVLLDLIAIGVQGIAHQFPNIGLPKIVFFLAGFNSREVQDVIDEGTEAFALFANDAVILVVFLLGTQASHFQSFRVQADEREGRAQFVRYVGNEI